MNAFAYLFTKLFFLKGNLNSLKLARPSNPLKDKLTIGSTKKRSDVICLPINYHLVNKIDSSFYILDFCIYLNLKIELFF